MRFYAPRIYQYVFYKYLKPDLVSFERAYGSFMVKWRKRRPPLKLMPGIAAEVESLSPDFGLGILGQAEPLEASFGETPTPDVPITGVHAAEPARVLP